eukprot:1507885-Rhodomonas_salina.2
MAAALDHYLGELRRADSAVRLGGDLGIKLGADYRNAYHNQIMYGVCSARHPIAHTRSPLPANS